MAIILRIINKSEKADKLRKLQLCSIVYQNVFYDSTFIWFSKKKKRKK